MDPRSLLELGGNWPQTGGAAKRQKAKKGAKCPLNQGERKKGFSIKWQSSSKTQSGRKTRNHHGGGCRWNMQKTRCRGGGQTLCRGGKGYPKDVNGGGGPKKGTARESKREVAGGGKNLEGSQAPARRGKKFKFKKGKVYKKRPEKKENRGRNPQPVNTENLEGKKGEAEEKEENGGHFLGAPAVLNIVGGPGLRENQIRGGDLG